MLSSNYSTNRLERVGQLAAATSLIVLLLTGCGFVLPPPPENFEVSVLATGLEAPWEITYGPDDHLWVTERMGKRVRRVNPATGQISTAVTIDEVYSNLSQEGLLGMVLHPELFRGSGQDYIYLAYTYATYAIDDAEDTQVKIRRYQAVSQGADVQLVDPIDILADLPASIDHNGSRLTLGPDGKLYYPIGDQGAGNFTSPCLPNDAQTLPTQEDIAAGNWRHYVGKILRLNLDGSIPADNPIFNGVQSHVYTAGHRNVQGMVAGDGQLYATEHGPKTDDEVNRIVSGGNYGWPHVAGYQDDQAYVYANWAASSAPCETLEHSEYDIPASVPLQQESEWNDVGFVPPLHTFGTVPTGHNFINEACEPSFYICWPSVAPAGMDFYDSASGAIPLWADSLLVAALKTGTIYRLPLNEAGDSIDGEPLLYFKTTNRYRDLAASPDGRTFYIATDNGGATQSPLGPPTDELEHPGGILVFTYNGWK